MKSSPPPVVVVTGASRGLGRAVALRCGAAQWRVAVHCHTRLADAESVVARIVDAGGDAFACPADVRDASAIQKLVERVMERWGRIDAWINNAGVVTDRLLVGMPQSAWNAVIATNLSGARHALQAVAPVMIQQRSGTIVNVTSLAALQGREGQTNYAASKAGLIGLTRSAARELAPYGIRVNAICPPVLDTATAGGDASSLRRQQLSPAAISLDQAADALVAVLGLPGMTGQTVILDQRIPNGTF